MLFGKYNGQHAKQKKAGKSRKGRERARGANDLGRHREGQGRDNVHCLRFCFHYRNIENEIERNAWQHSFVCVEGCDDDDAGDVGALLLGIKKYYAKRSQAPGLAKGGYTNTQ